jgi:hypothetical protein
VFVTTTSHSDVALVGLVECHSAAAPRVHPPGRVGEDVATLAPHSPERALLTHSVLRVRDSFSQA